MNIKPESNAAIPPAPAASSEEEPEEDRPSPPPVEDASHSFVALLFRTVPALDSLRSYSAHAFGSDLLAGLTVATVAVPQSMAYATIAGLPPQYGLYTAIVMTAIGALFDSSKQLINGPTNAISIAILSALAPFLAAGDVDRAVSLVFLLTFLVGGMQLLITLLRLGDLSRYISHSVVVGFTVGAAVLLVMDQLKNLLGTDAIGTAHEHFLKRFWLTLTQGGSINVWTVGVGLGTVLWVLGVRWLKARLGRRTVELLVPELLLAVILMAFLAWWFDLERKGVAVVGHVPNSLPSFGWPAFAWSDIRDLSGSAMAIAILGLLEAITMAKAIAAQTGQKLDINQQCLSEGMANVGGSFFQCMPGSGSLTRSAINQQAGAVSQWSGVISAIAVAVTVLLAARFAYHIPRAALAGILMLSAWNLVDRKQLFYHLRATRFDACIVVATALSAVVISVEFCILIGVFLSFVLFVPKAARIHMTQLTLTPERVLRERVASDPPCDRILIYNLEGDLFFGAAPQLDRHFSAIERAIGATHRVVVLRMKRVRNPDAVCLEMLERFICRMRVRKIELLLCGIRPDLAEALRRVGLEAGLGLKNIFQEKENVIWSSTLDAVRYAYDLLENDLCTTCPRREENASNKETWYYMI